MAKQINVVGAVIVKEGLVLCAQRGFEGALPGLWEFPGGKIEPGETPHEALVREISEEFFADITVGEQITTTTYRYNFGDVTLTTFFCTLNSENVTLTEHAAVKWLRPEELESLHWAPADVPAVELIAQKCAA